MADRSVLTAGGQNAIRASARSRVSTQSTMSMRHDYYDKKRDIPPHIKAMLYDPNIERKPFRLDYTVTGFLTERDIVNNLDKKMVGFPWDRVDRTADALGEAHKAAARPKRRKLFLERGKEGKSYKRFDEIVAKNKHGKIAFRDLGGVEKDTLSQWVRDRLEYVSQNLRFELPFDIRELEDMAPIDYLQRHTRMPKSLRRRYGNLFKMYKQPKPETFIRFDKLHPALNINFGGCLSKENLNLLTTALFLPKDSQLTEGQFIGLAAYTDRLFWTFFVARNFDINTMSFCASNRQYLEYVDMDSLKRKLAGFNISKEIHVLLRSLA